MRQILTNQAQENPASQRMAARGLAVLLIGGAFEIADFFVGGNIRYALSMNFTMAYEVLILLVTYLVDKFDLTHRLQAKS